MGFSSPSKLVSYSNNCPPASMVGPDEDVVLDRFRAYLRVIHGRQLHFTGPDRETGEVLEVTIPQANGSRYTKTGRQKIKRKLAKRLGHGRTLSVLLTLTVDPKRYTKSEAWQLIWKEYANFRRNLWKHLIRQGWKRNPMYIGVIEQHKSGFPHMHVCYPGLRYLAPKQVINGAWRMGSTYVKGGRRRGDGVMVSALGYVLKYVSKLAGWTEDGLAHLWHARARLYNISPKLKLHATPKEPKAPGWTLLKIEYTDPVLKDLARRLARLRFLYRTKQKRKEVQVLMPQRT